MKKTVSNFFTALFLIAAKSKTPETFGFWGLNSFEIAGEIISLRTAERDGLP